MALPALNPELDSISFKPTNVYIIPEYLTPEYFEFYKRYIPPKQANIISYDSIQASVTCANDIRQCNTNQTRTKNRQRHIKRKNIASIEVVVLIFSFLCLNGMFFWLSIFKLFIHWQLKLCDNYKPDGFLNRIKTLIYY